MTERAKDVDTRRWSIALRYITLHYKFLTWPKQKPHGPQRKNNKGKIDGKRPVHTRQQSCRKRQQIVAVSATNCCRFRQQFVAWCGQALRLPKHKCFKFSAELRKCVTRNNVCRQAVPQPSTSSGKGSVSNSCTLRLADVQLMGQWWPQTSRINSINSMGLYSMLTAYH